MLARENLEEDEPAAVATGDDYQLEQYQIVQRRQWEQTYAHMTVPYSAQITPTLIAYYIVASFPGRVVSKTTLGRRLGLGIWVSERGGIYSVNSNDWI